jgi:hypothetical protein
METSPPAADRPAEGLSSEKREDIWALLIALVVLLISLWAPEAVYTFFKKTLIVF